MEHVNEHHGVEGVVVEGDSVPVKTRHWDMGVLSHQDVNAFNMELPTPEGVGSLRVIHTIENALCEQAVSASDVEDFAFAREDV